MKYYKKSVVIFFSFILFFSIYANLPNNSYAAPGDNLRYFVNGGDGLGVNIQETNPYTFSSQVNQFNITGQVHAVKRCDPPTKGGTDDFIYPNSDIYITKQIPSEGHTIVDVSSIPNTIVAWNSGGFFGVDDPEIIGFITQNGIGNGVYHIVYDNCQDGNYISEQDTIFKNAFKRLT